MAQQFPITITSDHPAAAAVAAVLDAIDAKARVPAQAARVATIQQQIADLPAQLASAQTDLDGAVSYAAQLRELAVDTVGAL
jgi:hypothetical protein